MFGYYEENFSEFCKNYYAEAEKYKKAGDTTSMTEWTADDPYAPLLDRCSNAYIRRRKNGDWHYEVLLINVPDQFGNVRKGLEEPVFEAKTFEFDLTEDLFYSFYADYDPLDRIKYPDFATALLVYERDFDHLPENEPNFQDAGIEYMMSKYFKKHSIGGFDGFEGVNLKGETPTTPEGYRCTPEELKSWAEKRNLDLESTYSNYRRCVRLEHDKRYDVFLDEVMNDDKLLAEAAELGDFPDFDEWEKKRYNGTAVDAVEEKYDYENDCLRE